MALSVYVCVCTCAWTGHNCKKGSRVQGVSTHSRCERISSTAGSRKTSSSFFSSPSTSSSDLVPDRLGGFVRVELLAMALGQDLVVAAIGSCVRHTVGCRLRGWWRLPPAIAVPLRAKHIFHHTRPCHVRIAIHRARPDEVRDVGALALGIESVRVTSFR